MKQHLKCLRCGFEYTPQSEPQEVLQERVCPKCQSNSVRRISSKEKSG